MVKYLLNYNQKDIKEAIKLAKSEIKEWQKFLKLSEKELIFKNHG